MEDYQSYVRQRQQLFEINEILRAVLKHGGLIWHLAVGMERERFEEVVLSGPSRRVMQIGGRKEVGWLLVVGALTTNLGICIGDFKCENQAEWRKFIKLCRNAPKAREAFEKDILSHGEFVFF